MRVRKPVEPESNDKEWPVSLKEKALSYHGDGRPGKLKVVPTKPTVTATDLALAYSPGVAQRRST